MTLNYEAVKSIIKRDDVVRIFDALHPGGACYIVGGAVRDALLGLQTADIDFAVPFAPDETEMLLNRAGIPAVPTGKSHGTISAIIGKKAYEITSMRKDIETDGRFAIVEYCTDLSQDAKRRDFTINALYCDENGNIHDPNGEGLNDLRNKVLKFVGAPDLRIKEDFLRILRLYRFYAQLEYIEIDQSSETAAKNLAPNIKNLSVERVWSELKKLATGPRLFGAIKKLEECGIWWEFFQSKPQYDCLSNLLDNEDFINLDPITRLLSLLPIQSDLEFCNRLKMSNLEKNRFVARKKAFESQEKSYEVLAYLYSNQTAMDLYFARENPINRETISRICGFVRPNFPIKSNIIAEAGVMPGPKLGAILKAAETCWLKNGFSISNEELDAIISQFNARQ